MPTMSPAEIVEKLTQALHEDAVLVAVAAVRDELEQQLAAEHNPPEAKPVAMVELIDVAAHAIEIFGEEGARAILPPDVPFRRHDYRFHVTTPSGAYCTFGHQTTAAEIAGWLKREGVLTEDTPTPEGA